MKISTNTISEVISFYKSRLCKSFTENEAKILIRQLIAFYCRIGYSNLPLMYENRLSESELLAIHRAVEKLENHIPLQYILGETEFLNCKILVNPAVLIPRPETEEMVSMIIKEHKSDQHLKILDIATGSACIAIALSKNLSSLVIAVDNSQEALDLAKKNSTENKTEIDFQNRDILLGELNLIEQNDFDIIVSNPPYVCESEKVFMDKNVLENEPYSALFVSDYDPLQFYKIIIDFAFERLKANGELWLEINESFGNEMKDLLEVNFRNVQIINDFRDKVRFAKAIKHD